MPAIPYRRYTGNESGPGTESEELIWNVYGIENIKKKFTDIISRAKHEIRIIAHPQIIITGNSRETRLIWQMTIKVEIVTPQWDGRDTRKNESLCHKTSRNPTRT